jgi:hypothetical protein
MGDQSTTFITPRQGCFSTESAKTGRSQPELDYPKAAGGGLLDATLFQSLGFLEVSALTA